MRKSIVIPVVVIFVVLVSSGFWKHDALFEAIWNFLVVNQKPQPSDVIIVISGGVERAPFGVELYKQGYAPKLLFSGGSSRYMKGQAISLGVPEKDILIETKSGTTFGNASHSAEIMQAQGFKSAILVTSPFHTRRASIIFKEFFKDWKLTVCATPYDPAIAANWWKDKQSRKWVITEYLKLVYHYLVER